MACLFLSLVYARSIEAVPRNADKSEAEKRLETAQALTDIRTNSSPSFRLSASVKLFDEQGQAQQGTYQLRWKTPTQWKDELRLPDFSQFRLANGGRMFISRNPGYLSVQTFRLLRLLSFPTSVVPFSDEKVSKKIATDGREERIEVRFHGEVERVVHLDATSSVPTRIDWGKNGTGLVFQNYSPFGNHQVPRTLLQQQLGKPFIEIQIQELASEAFGADSFTPPSDAPSIQWCPDPAPAQLLSNDQIQIPPALRDSLKHRVVIYGVMGSDRQWHNIFIVKSGGKEVDSFWTNVLVREKFSPAMCGSEAVVQETVREFYLP